MSESKILCFDIESAGVNALKADLGFVILFGYKWLHEKQAHVLMIDKESLRQFDDKKLLQQASKLLEEADLLVAHFGSVFDRRFIQGRLLIHGLPPIPPTKMRDTCMIARSVANYSSNRLKHLAKILRLRHRKLENGWPEAWFQVMQGNMKALKGLAAYCVGDVQTLEDLYLRLRPYDNPHPRMRENPSVCAVCGGAQQRRGYRWAQQYRYQRYQCTKCKRWSHDSHRVKNACIAEAHQESARGPKE